MNLWARRLGLIFVSALAFFSCQKDEELNTIGLPPENNLGIFFVDIPLGDDISQVWAGDINSRASGSILVGSYEDPYLGTITAQNFSELVLPSLNPGKAFGADAAFDSLVLEMRLRDASGVNLQSNTQKLEVYQLSDTIAIRDHTFTNSSMQDYGMKLGEKEFVLHSDSIGLNFSDTELPDSVDERALYDASGVYMYMTKVRMDDGFGQTLFDDLKSDTTETGKFGTSEAFAAYIKGLHIQGAPGNSSVLDYNPDDTGTRLVLYYSQEVDDSVVQRTVKFSISRSISYHNIQPNENSPWTNSDLSGLTEFYVPYQTEGDLAYVQSGTHLFMKIDLSSFHNFADTLENPIIQGAELILNAPLNMQEDKDARLLLPDNLSFNVTSADSLANHNYNINPEFLSEVPQTGSFNSDDNRYKIEIPVYLQSLVNNKNVYDQLILGGSFVDPAFNASRVDNVSVKRVIIPKENIRIRLYYTIPNAVN